MTELVVLVDEQNKEIGTAAKDTVHTKDTPLHRGFSVFLFNSQKQVLLTKRADSKKTFPGVWTNAVCGHPALNEDVISAGKRRLADELELTNIELKVVSGYRYRFTDKNGIVENEICPILVGNTDNNPTVNPQEVSDWQWMDWREFLLEIKNHSDIYSPWCREEAAIIASLELI